jgi:hypothetical protein
MNAYLGAQGNQTLLSVFREASPNSLFFYPQVNALSASPENFGFSAALAEHRDFLGQPLSRHLDRLRQLGVRYLLIYSPTMKQRLAQEAAVGSRFDFGDWSIFQLASAPAPLAQVPPFLPALVVSDFTVKRRRNNDHNFIRLAEEQFADNWFEVLLVRAPTMRIDELGDLSRFGALILERYEYDDLELAYQRLRQFAQQRPLLLLARDTILFHRIRSEISNFPLAEVIEQQPGGGEDHWLGDTIEARDRYLQNLPQQEWAQIRRALEAHKVPTPGGSAVVEIELEDRQIRLTVNGAKGAGALPVLIRESFHPNWSSAQGAEIYAATPMHMMIFVDESGELRYGRRWYERVSAVASAATLLCLILYCAKPSLLRIKHRRDGRL